ncbi:MAG TPA: MmcQ/YjbR family DNA-binding protein [Gemmatimonadales bacterium]|nr:MmcQ/YjbR family DNA-binding protein [Gemmatimonadales bacterium]
MTATEFRRLALDLSGAVEAAHMGHPDFRVGGKIFATLGYPRAGFGVVMLTPEQQALFVRAEPKTFAPVPGGWGRQGSTRVMLRTAKKSAVREALKVAWSNRAPARKK